MYGGRRRSPAPRVSTATWIESSAGGRRPRRLACARRGRPGFHAASVRVALVGPYPVDETRIAGGVETSFATLVEGLSTFSDLDLHVLTFARGSSRRVSRRAGGVPVDFLPVPRRFNNLTRYRADRRALSRALNALEPDLIHAQDALAYGFTSLKAASGIPVVVSVHGIVREERKHLASAVDRLRSTVGASSLERYCIAHARYLVQPTRYAERYFGAEIGGRIMDVGNPISDRFFSAAPSPVPGRIVYAGAVIRRKRLRDLVDAVAIVRRSFADVALHVAGAESDPAYLEDVRVRVRELGLEDRVMFLGALAPAALLEEYRQASLLVLPSGQETSPMVIGEAMAVGLPVVATLVGGVPNLIDESRTGFLVDVGDVGALAARISYLLGNGDARRAMGTAAAAEAHRRFRSTAVAARVRDVYLAALDSGTQRQL